MIVAASATFAGTAQFTTNSHGRFSASAAVLARRVFVANLQGAVRAAVARPVAVRTFMANPIVNGSVLEPTGRTMSRSFVDRSMNRPFVDRSMSRPDTE